MNNVDALDALLGFFIPPIIGLLTKESWPGWCKGVAMLLLSLIIAGIKTAWSGQFDVNGEHLAATFFVIAASAQVSYQAVTKEFSKQMQTVGPIKDQVAAKPASFTEINDF